MSKAVVWFEVMGQNAATLQRFYGGLLGWELNFDNPMKYAMLQSSDDADKAGIGGGVGVSENGSWSTFYLAVDDINAHVGKAQELGGSVRMPATQMPDGNWIAVVSDPDGNAIGFYQEA